MQLRSAEKNLLFLITVSNLFKCLYRVIHESGISEFLFAATHYTHCNNILI
jgi:hypothetical protein